MRTLLPFTLLLSSLSWTYDFNLVAQIPVGKYNGNLLAGDFDHDGRNELALSTIYDFGWGWDIWRCRADGQFELALRDTARQNLILFAAGDFDQDSLTDIVCTDVNWPVVDTLVLRIFESPTYRSLPNQLVWTQKCDSGFTSMIYEDSQILIADLDQDGREEIILKYLEHLRCFRNDGRDNSYEQFLAQELPDPVDWGAAVVDLDRDGMVELVAASIYGQMLFLFEWCEADTFVEVWQDKEPDLPVSDLFGSRDTDGDSLPELFVTYYRGRGDRIDQWLYRYQSDGHGGYQRLVVDSLKDRPYGLGYYVESASGDVDCDGVDEVVWSTGHMLRLYKATGVGKYRLEWVKTLPSDIDTEGCLTIFDFNQNGYPEIAVSRHDDWTRFYEIDTTTIPGVAEKLGRRGECRLRVLSNPCQGQVRLEVQEGDQPPAAVVVNDAAGRLVRKLFPSALKPGAQRLVWDGKDCVSRDVPPGVYFLGFDTPVPSSVCKVVLLR